MKFLNLKNLGFKRRIGNITQYSNKSIIHYDNTIKHMIELTLLIVLSLDSLGKNKRVNTYVKRISFLFIHQQYTQTPKGKAF